MKNSDEEWEKWGKNDPYFGVFTHEKFRSKNLTQETKAAFFESGRRDIQLVLAVCRQHFDPQFTPQKVLDFGCGTGRLVIPFAEIAAAVVGMDVSDSMLQETRKNCHEHGLNNVSLLKSDDTLSFLEGEFDLIHSVIVFQHIPVARGRLIFTNLINHLKVGGIGAIQITYAKAIFSETYGLPPVELSTTNHKSERSRRGLDKLRKMFNRNRNHDAPPYQDPQMQMNPYNVNELFFILQSAGIQNTYVEFTNHGGELGLFLYFQKPA